MGDFRLTVLGHRRELREIGPTARLLRGSLGSANWDWCRDDPPDVVFHCARMAGNGRWGRYFAAARGQLANRRLIRMLRELPKPPRVVYASGSLMYGDHGAKPVTEDAPLRPISYAREYVLAERPFLSIRGDAPPVMMFRPGWILGAGSWFERFYWEPARQSRVVPVYGAGSNLMTLVHREDCAAAMIWVAQQGEPGIYHPPSLPAVTQRAFAEQVGSALDFPMVERPLAGCERAVREAFTASMDLRSVRGEFWKAYRARFTDLKGALQNVISEYKARTPQNASTG